MVGQFTAHGPLIRRRDFVRQADLGVDDDARLGIRRALDLAASVFHALIGVDGSGDPVDYRKHVVRAGFNTGMTAYARLLVYDRMWIGSFFSFQLLKVKHTDECFGDLALVWRRVYFHALQEGLATRGPNRHHRESSDRQHPDESDPAIPRQPAER